MCPNPAGLGEDEGSASTGSEALPPMTAHNDEQLPPSVLAARRTAPHARDRARAAGRAYPAIAVDDDVAAAGPHLAATRALLAAATPDEVAGIVVTLVHDLGGGIVPVRLAGTDVVLPVDVSLGLSEPMLAWADPVSMAAMRLSRILPTFVEDARTVVGRLRGEQLVADEAERDPVTGLLTRRAWMRRLSVAADGDTVCLIDLDHFKHVNDTAGHPGGDEVLGAIGALLLRAFRTADACGRYGGDELACLISSMPVEAVARRLDQLHAAWASERPPAAAGLGFSVGIARTDQRGPRAALAAADRALYRVKASGRNATATATADDYREA